MKHQQWMNDRLDQHAQQPSRIQYEREEALPLLSWYLVSAAFTIAVLFI